MRLFQSLLFLPAAALIAACDQSSAPVAPEEAAFARGASGSTPAQLNRQLAELRQATAQFHNFGKAIDAEYTFLFMNMCMQSNQGGMGFHYVNTGLLDNVVEISRPEALLYEPGPNGQRRLVGVEYVIPKDAWTSTTPPELFGQQFTLNAFGLWALHVWIWKHNPNGMFADWNPNVSCEHAAH